MVDDDPDTVEMLGGLLEGEEYKVLYAYGGEECLAKLSSEEVDVDLLKKLGFKQTIRIMTAYPIDSVIREPSDEE